MGFSSSRSLAQLLILAMSLCFMDQIQAASTSTSCPPNTKFGCKSTCFNNCDNLNSTSDVCNKMCMLGCNCIEGYVLESKDLNVCVPISQCKVSCPERMTFNPCLRTPRLSCATLGIHYTESRVCMPRCVCNEGYVLSNDAERKCIKTSQCPKPSIQ
ncbi:uncharacterized protein O3C94_013325 [Discoglossus pictus]